MSKSFPEWWKHGQKVRTANDGVLTLNIAEDSEYWLTNNAGKEVSVFSMDILGPASVPEACSMTTDITELAQSLKAAAHKAKQANDLYLEGKITLSECVIETKDYLDYSDNPNNILALVEALEKAQQEADELSKFKEVMASAAEALKTGKPLNLESLFKGELASAMFSMMFAGEFVRSGATNYLELLYDVPEFGEMTVTLQKVEGKTPGQRIAELESRTVTINTPDARDEDYDWDGQTPSEAFNTCRMICALMFRQSLRAAGIKVEAE
ncbi:TPA: hypothetical protein ACYU77_002978 [Klebsiella variicola subsp. variicola]